MQTRYARCSQQIRTQAVRRPRMLSDLQQQQFGQNGYVVVDDVISLSLIDDLLSTCDGIANGLARDAVAAGAAPAEILGRPGPAKIVALTRLTGRGFGQYLYIHLPPARHVPAATPHHP